MENKNTTYSREFYEVPTITEGPYEYKENEYEHKEEEVV